MAARVRELSRAAESETETVTVSATKAEGNQNASSPWSFHACRPLVVSVVIVTVRAVNDDAYCVSLTLTD